MSETTLSPRAPNASRHIVEKKKKGKRIRRRTEEESERTKIYTLFSNTRHGFFTWDGNSFLETNEEERGQTFENGRKEQMDRFVHEKKRYRLKRRVYRALVAIKVKKNGKYVQLLPGRHVKGQNTDCKTQRGEERCGAGRRSKRGNPECPFRGWEEKKENEENKNKIMYKIEKKKEKKKKRKGQNWEERALLQIKQNNNDALGCCTRHFTFPSEARDQWKLVSFKLNNRKKPKRRLLRQKSHTRDKNVKGTRGTTTILACGTRRF
ncbi:hypothetical protein PUN28_000816 [Cardiocondyla obscurior]|uniref:Uncharacterized protein n=1 Tax=Cardiocondyla obscurior TaxID=286306 RepID=A0AAW2H1T8_9HYME